MSTSLHIKGSHNLTFIHIPKTAGSSIGEWIKSSSSLHDNIIARFDKHENLEMIRKNYEKNFTITSVRNPWDRAFSLYCFLGKAFEPKNSISPEMKMWVDYYYEVTKSDWNFNNFLASLSNLKVHPEWWFTLSTPQAAWVREPIDYVIKYETLETDFKKIREIKK